MLKSIGKVSHDTTQFSHVIFQRALLREFAGLAGAVFMTLFAIALTTRLIRLLGQAAGGKIPSDAVIAFLGFFSLGALPVLLSLTMFISVLLTLTRGWRDSEMVIWFGAGLSLAAWLRPVMLFALPQIAVITALSLYISPWAAQMSEQYRTKVEARDDVSRISPGVFGETSNKERVFFVESISGDASAVQNVFVSSVHQKKSGVSMSRTGRTEAASNGDRFIVLEDGRRYEGMPGDAEYRVMEFDR
jgi:lipopolysaccharide export system permease protein